MQIHFAGAVNEQTAKEMAIKLQGALELSVTPQATKEHSGYKIVLNKPEFEEGRAAVFERIRDAFSSTMADSHAKYLMHRDAQPALVDGSYADSVTIIRNDFG